MRPFIHDDFLLHGETARHLYHEVAADLPIIDYHCHVPAGDIASNRRFANLTEIWLEGDHYKWRAMRANGIDEAYCTGNAEPYEKFLAWARTVPMTYRNPLYHWSHLELKRYFDIDETLDESTAPAIWEKTGEALQDRSLSVHGILETMRVETVCTTDNPADTLEHHAALAANPAPARVFPAFRPDDVLSIGNGKTWQEDIQRLAASAQCPIDGYDSLLQALQRRHDHFHQHGCRLSDHGLTFCPAAQADRTTLDTITKKALDGGPVTAREGEQFVAALLLEVGRWNAGRGWVMQLHLGALRAANSRLTNALGRDCGFDSIGDWPQAERLAWFLDHLDRDNLLPPTILYNLNPADNYAIATMIGNFNDGSRPGKVQMGSGWWFLDQKEGMEWQINALSNLGLIRHFIGMLTDSRSFLSYCRHEYFRRILCNVFGRDVENGELPDDRERLAEYVRAICHENARAYFPGFKHNSAK